MPLNGLSRPNKDDQNKLVAETTYEVEEMQVTRREEQPKPEPQQQVTEILNIVNDNVNIDDNIDFDVEADASQNFSLPVLLMI